MGYELKLLVRSSEHRQTGPHAAGAAFPGQLHSSITRDPARELRIIRKGKQVKAAML